MVKGKIPSLKKANELARQAYDLAAAQYHALFHNELDQKPYDQELLADFMSRLDPQAWILDAGCGPSGHIGAYLLGHASPILGIDISRACILMAKRHNPKLHYMQNDMSSMALANGSMGGVISYYSIIHCPKSMVSAFFKEFYRVLMPGGCLLVAVKAGMREAMQSDLLGIETEIYFSLFSEDEICGFLQQVGFTIEFIDRRDPYHFEIENERVFAIGRKPST